ncbi:MAG: alginate lyase family protein [Anaerolineales bacterium]
MKLVSPRMASLAIRELGLRAILEYGWYQIELWSGMLRRRTKPFRWEQRPLRTWLREQTRGERVLPQRERFLFRPEADLSDELAGFHSGTTRKGSEEADEILAGRWRLFGGPPIQLGFPPDWGRPPLADGSPQLVPLNRHWTQYQLDGEVDYRSLWEPARFGWCFTLGRAYRLTGIARYRDGYFTLLDSWLEANLPNLGPHWASGQEVALRMLALIFGYFVFRPLAPEREEQILVAIAAHADRIPATLGYARAQRNNHLLSEAVGLYSAGLLFADLDNAHRWKALGRRWLVHALEDQVFEDGGYIQHSTNYQRLALAAGLWAARLAQLHNEPLPPGALQALTRMTHFLNALTDPRNGRVPNLGHNDGSNLLPLSSCESADYRPILQAASLALLGRPAFEPGPWDELALWLGVPVGWPSAAEQRPSVSEFPKAGLYLLHSEQSRGALRSARFVSRPSHSDQLHFDLWWQGHNLARDPGSYRYTGELGAALAAARAHNGVLVDGLEPMVRAGRFLWLGWSNARFLAGTREGPLEALAAEHSISGVTHRRSIVHTGDTLWVVIDELLGQGVHHGQIIWTLPDWEWVLDVRQLTLEGEPGRVTLMIEPVQASLGLYRAGKRLAGELVLSHPEQLGWWAPNYGTKEAALSLVVQFYGALPARLATWWRLGSEGLAGLALAYAQDQLAL